MFRTNNNNNNKLKFSNWQIFNFFLIGKTKIYAIWKIWNHVAKNRCPCLGFVKVILHHIKCTQILVLSRIYLVVFAVTILKEKQKALHSWFEVIVLFKNISKLGIIYTKLGNSNWPRYYTKMLLNSSPEGLVNTLLDKLHLSSKYLKVSCWK